MKADRHQKSLALRLSEEADMWLRDMAARYAMSDALALRCFIPIFQAMAKIEETEEEQNVQYR
jgi:hypothetical protein